MNPSDYDKEAAAYLRNLRLDPQTTIKTSKGNFMLLQDIVAGWVKRQDDKGKT